VAVTKNFNDKFFQVEFPTAEDDGYAVINLRFKYEATGRSPESWAGSFFIAGEFPKLQI
jgi:hypothetical protein